MSHGRMMDDSFIDENPFLELLNRDNTYQAVFGVEQEFAVFKKHAPYRAPNAGDDEPGNMKYIHTTEGIESHITSAVAGYYGKNGSLIGNGGLYVRDGRIYKDVVNLEICSAECSDPFEMAQRLENLRNCLRQYTLIKERTLRLWSNSNLSNGGGSLHESYFQNVDDETFDSLNFSIDIMPPLITRMVLTGTGGPHQKGRMTLSPRMYEMYEQSCMSAGNHRGIIMDRDEPLVVEGRRFQLISSDQIVSPELIALQVGMTAFAIRLCELGMLPDTPIDWFSSRDFLNEIQMGTAPPVFVAAIEYQCELLTRAWQYHHASNALGYPPLLGTQESTCELLELWERKLDLLKTYCQDHDLEALSEEFEWAQKHSLVYKNRKKAGQEMSAPLSGGEAAVCIEITALIPANEKYVVHQKPFTNFRYDDSSFSVQRAGVRARFIEMCGKHLSTKRFIGTGMLDWMHCTLKGDHVDEFFQLSQPESGSNDDIDRLFGRFFDALKRTSTKNRPLIVSSTNTNLDVKAPPHVVSSR